MINKIKLNKPRTRTNNYILTSKINIYVRNRGKNHKKAKLHIQIRKTFKRLQFKI